MAALIASPKNSLQNNFTQNVMYTYGKTKNTPKVSLYRVSFQFVLYNAFKENTKKGKPKEKRTDAKQQDRSQQSMWFGLRPPDSQFTVQTAQIDTDYRHMICLGFAPVHIEFFIYFSNHPPPMAYVTWWWWWRLVGWLVYRGVILHGLSTQQISRQQGVNGGGAPDHTAVVAAWRPPQAGIMGHPAPQQVASTGLASAAPLANGVGLCRPAHTVLIGSWVGLPASGVVRQGLALCKEAVHLLLAGELRQDGGVSKHTPCRERQERKTEKLRLSSFHVMK